MHELLIFVVWLCAITVMVVSTLFAIDAMERRNDTPYWERKARKYERKADRLRSICVLMSAFPFPCTDAPHRNLTAYIDRYKDLATECRKK